jgi:exopolyphosphatase/guanosine-5'-triphosphate,3'-diphosphate pyrophosphatase
VAGTITTLAAVRAGRYDPDLVHGMDLSAAEVDAIVDRLAALPLAERRAVPGLHPDRAPVIIAGGLILASTLRALGVDGLVVSERDGLDGAVLGGGGTVPVPA